MNFRLVFEIKESGSCLVASPVRKTIIRNIRPPDRMEQLKMFPV